MQQLLVLYDNVKFGKKRKYLLPAVLGIEKIWIDSNLLNNILKNNAKGIIEKEQSNQRQHGSSLYHTFCETLAAFLKDCISFGLKTTLVMTR